MILYDIMINIYDTLWYIMIYYDMNWYDMWLQIMIYGLSALYKQKW